MESWLLIFYKEVFDLNKKWFKNNLKSVENFFTFISLIAEGILFLFFTIISVCFVLLNEIPVDDKGLVVVMVFGLIVFLYKVRGAFVVLFESD